MSGGKGSNTTTTNTSPNPMAMGAYADVLGRAQGVANLPYTPYGGELVAGINQQQNLGIGNINQNAGFAQPFIGQAAQYANNAAQPITAAQIQNYQNPYTQQVVNATEAQFQNQNAQQQSQLLGNAASQHALGGDRVGVAQANLAGQQALAQNPIIAGLYSQGYQNAEQMALAQQQAMAQGAYSLGNLGVAGQNAALQGAGAQFGVGSAQQQTQQAEDTARLQQFQQQQAFPYQQAQWLAGIDSGIGSQMGGQSQTIGPPPNPWAQYAGLGLAGAGLLAPSKQGATGGRIAGFADGGSPFGSAMPYSGVGGYIPTINLPIGNTMPKGGTGGNGAAVAPAFDPTKMAQLGKGAGAGLGNLASNFSSGNFGIGSDTGNYAFDDNGDVISAGNYELGGASGGRVRGFADAGRVPDDVYFNPTPMTGGLGSGSVIDHDRHGSSVVDATDLPPVSEDRLGIAPGQNSYWDRGNNAALTADIPDEVRYGNSKGAGASPMPSSALGYDEVQPRAEEPTGGFAPRPGQAPQRGNVGLANAFGMSDAAKMGLLSAGFGMMASKSPFLGSAIGEGGLAGVQGYVGQKERERSAKEKQDTINLQVQKLQDSANQYQRSQTETERHNKQAEAVAKLPPGYRYTPEGNQTFIPGGPHDPASVRAEATARRLPGMSEDAMRPMIDAYKGGNSAVLSQIARGTSGPQNLEQFWNMLSADLKAEGKTGKDLNAARANFMAQSAAAKTAAVREANVETSVNEAVGTFPLVIQRSLELPRSEIVPFNVILQKFREGTSSPEQGRLAVALQGAITAYSQAMSRTGANSVHAQQHAESLLHGTTGHEGLKARLDQMGQEMEIARNAPDETRKHILDRILGVEAPAAKIGTPAPAASDKPVPTQKDIDYVKSHPEVRQRFIDRFGREP